MADHIHVPGDGRGLRDVFVNGNKIGNVFWADTKSGVVVFAPSPIRVHKRKKDEIYCRKLRGKVEVSPCES